MFGGNDVVMHGSALLVVVYISAKKAPTRRHLGRKTTTRELLPPSATCFARPVHLPAPSDAKANAGSPRGRGSSGSLLPVEQLRVAVPPNQGLHQLLPGQRNALFFREDSAEPQCESGGLGATGAGEEGPRRQAEDPPGERDVLGEQQHWRGCVDVWVGWVGWVGLVDAIRRVEGRGV